MQNEYYRPEQPLENVLLNQRREQQPREQQPRVSSRFMLEYMPNADFQLWLQRTAKSLTVCLVSFVAFWFICQCFSGFRHALYDFFRWVLIPVKPLLVAKPSMGLVGFVSLLTPFANLLNFLMIPLVGILAFRAGKLPSYLYLTGEHLLMIQQLRASESGRGDAFSIDDKTYKVVGSISLSSIKKISVERPRGKKSCRDYVLHLSNDKKNLVLDLSVEALVSAPTLAVLTREAPPLSRIRWGDIIKVEDRNRFLNFLEGAFPHAIDATVFEPFRQAPERQSYTELWLRELSGAPKRDKLSPLGEGTKLANDCYTVLRKVGVGGQGTVYLAASANHSRDDSDLVVLKEFVLPVFPDLRVRKKAAERFQAEASMLSRLNHPQIAQFLDLFVEDHRAYLVLEHVDGTTLKDRVAAEGPLPEQQVIELAKQVAEILEYLHSQTPAVVHRDLTPDNIMLGQDGLAKLIDFSVAQELASGVTGSVVGKPNYISPEQFRGKPTAQSDIYSLGASMFYLLIGRDPPAITVLHPHAVNDRISVEIDAIIARCTQLDPNKRYENAAQILADLQLLQLR